MSRYFEHDEAIKKGRYPKIHDKLKAIIDVENDINGKSVLDLGACTGSFGLWALRNGARDVIVNDMRPSYIDKAKEYDVIHRDMYGYTGNFVTDNQKITAYSYLPYPIDTLIARRIIYELRNDEVRSRFINQMINAGVKTVYLQGLVRVPNHIEPLWNVELEAQMFIDKGFKVEYYNQNDCMKLVI